MPSEQIAFLGLGAMGIHMAANLANSLKSPLLVWNRTISKADNVASKNITPTKTLQGIADSADIIFSCLGSDKAVESVYEELVPLLKPGTIIAEQSTVDPAVHQRIIDAAKERKVHFLAANIFGPVPLAKSAQLVLCLAGEEQLRHRLEPILVPAVAKSCIHVGDDPILGSKMKLIGNGVVIGCMELCAQSITLADKTGVSGEKIREYFDHFFNTPSFMGYSLKMLENSFIPPGFSIEGGLKDVNHIRKLAASVNCPAPTVDLAHEHLMTARSMGNPELDWSSLVLGMRASAGLRPDSRTEPAQALPTDFGKH